MTTETNDITTVTDTATNTTVSIDDRVEGGTGEDYDTGRVIEVRMQHGAEALVAWDSGVRTWTPVSILDLI